MTLQSRPCVLPVAVAVLMLCAPAGAAWGQSWAPSWLSGGTARLGSWSAALGLSYMNGESTNSAPGSASSSTRSSGTSETLQIGNSGFFLLSPRLFRGDLSLDVALNHDNSSGVGNELSTQGKAVGYAFDGTFLSEKPYPVSVYANKNNMHTVQASGSLLQNVNANHGVSFQLHPDSILNDWGYPWTEGHLDLRSESNQSSTSSFGRTYVTQDQSKEMEFSASKGFETADLVVNARVNERNNPLLANAAFRSTSSSVNYSLDFGPTLNRRFDANVSYAGRDGLGASTSVSSSEHLQIDHRKGLQTEYNYDFSRQAVGADVTTMKAAKAALHHQLYKNLATDVSVSANHNSLPTGTMDSYGLQLSQSYKHGLPGKGIFNANWSGNYQKSSNKLSSSNVTMVDERHDVVNPMVAGSWFVLGRKFAVRSSIVVVDIYQGGRVVLQEGTDYDVVVEGNDTKVYPRLVPGAFPNLDGHPLLVSYSYQVDASLDYETRSRGFGLGVNYQWVGVTYRHQQAGQTALNQTVSQFLQDSVQDTLQIDMHGTVLKMDSNAQLVFERKNASDSDSMQTKFSAGSQWLVNPALRVTMNVQASQATYTRPDQRVTVIKAAQSAIQWPAISLALALNATNSAVTWPVERTEDALAARASVNWFSDGGWINSAALDWSTRTTSPMPTETLIQFLAQTSVTRGKLSLSANIGLGQWLSNGNRSVNRSMNMSAVRQF